MCGLLANIDRVRARRSIDLASGIALAMEPSSVKDVLRAAGVPESSLMKMEHERMREEGRRALSSRGGRP